MINLDKMQIKNEDDSYEQPAETYEFNISFI